VSTPPDFFQGEAVRALLARASRAAGVPMAIHYVERGEEGPLISSVGGCAACKYVASLSGGAAACRRSRMVGEIRALRQGRPVTASCHLGFGILSTPALEGEHYVLNLGPFVPAGGDEALEREALEACADITGELLDAFPVTLRDIHRTPPGAMLAMAEWVVEELRRLRAEGEPPPAVNEELGPAPATRTRADIGAPRITDAQALATAIAGANRRRVRAILAACAAEAFPLRGQRSTDTATPLLALLTQSLAACRRAGIEVSTAMPLVPQAALALARLSDPEAQVDSVLRVLRPLMRAPVMAQARTLLEYRPLDRLVEDSLPEGIPLGEVATQLQKSPTAVTHHLQRRFGMNYSEYQGRMRVERARELLRRTQLSATAIAIRIGVDDQSNFGKLFKRHMGMSPGSYRARFGKKR